MNTATLRTVALPLLALAALSSTAQAVTILENFGGYTASTTPVTGLTAAPGFGSATGGWLQGWRSASSTTAATARILDSGGFAGGGNYLSGTFTSNSTTNGTLDGIALARPYDVAGNSLASAASLYYTFDLRIDTLPSTMRIDIFDNRIRGSGADGSNTSWHMRAVGGFWYVLNGASVVSTTMAATAGVAYSITVQSDPAARTWSYTINNGTTSVSGSSLNFRNASAFGTDSDPASSGGRWFGVSAAEITDVSAQAALFSLDNLSIGTTSPIPEPSAFALLGGAVALGCAAGRRRRR